ncbi:hypothetical protein GGR58DRAFT_527346 [Xylaria digitata]|nr:hypothetical protein GGR58DRAFT_527346 [Xylaria digitata]
MCTPYVKSIGFQSLSPSHRAPPLDAFDTVPRMMYLKLLVILIAAAAAHADALPVASEFCITDTAPYCRPWSTSIPPFPKSVSSSPSTQPKSTFIKRKYTGCLHGDNTGGKKDRMIITLIIVNLILEFIIIALVIWLGWSTYFRQWCRERCLQRNPERQRAEQLLNSHPQPIDLELGVVHARSSPQWPLTDGIETRVNSPNNCQTKRKCPSTGASIYYDTRDNHTQTALVETGNVNVDAEGIDITDTAISKTYMAGAEITRAFEPITEDSEPDLDMSHHTEAFNLEGPLSSAGCELETYSFCSNRSSMGSCTTNSMSQNEIIVKDWAYHRL